MDQENYLKRWWDFSAAILLLAAVLTAAARLVSTNWTEHLSITQTLAFFGVITGFALGISIFSHRTAITLSAAYGTFLIPWQLGLTIEEDLIWPERLQILVDRLSVIIEQLANKEPVQDSLLFLLVMAILFWILSVHSGFTLVRFGSAWGSVLPTGSAMFMIHAFDALITRRSWYLAIYIFFSLVIVARMVYVQRQERWQKTRTALPPHLGLDFIRFTIAATFVIIVFSWTIPALANASPTAQRIWQPIEQVWNKTRDQFENAFASLRSSVGFVSQYYGASTSLGQGIPLSDDHVFTARAPDNLPVYIRLYWRARTYDTYDKGQWYSTINTAYLYNPEEDQLPLPVEAGRWLGTFNIISQVNLSTLYTPSQPVWTNRTGQVEYALNPDGTLDISTFRAVPSINPGEVYQAHSSINDTTENQLKSAGTLYPEWISERYLQIPETTTLRTRQLAAEITAGLETPYEKAAAITDYLRKNIEYVETIETELPDNQDLIDWFLFDYKKGFCNYFATAEVILLRSVGIPARWAVGYAEGERIVDEKETGRGIQTSGGNIIVRQKDAHAWPEVYFPKFGWVEFEPTTSQPIILRLPGDRNNGENGASSSEIPSLEILLREMEEEMALLRQQQSMTASNDEQPTNSPKYLGWVMASGVAGVLAFLGWYYRKRIKLQPLPILIEKAYHKLGIQPPKLIQRLALQAGLPPLVKAYHEINKALIRLGKKPEEMQTPAERAQDLAALIPEIQEPALELVHEYEKEIFGLQHANLVIAYRSAGDIKRISNRASINFLIQRIPALSKLFTNPKHDVKSQV